MATVQGDNPPRDDGPPLLDVSDRPAATPGPLTKPSPTIRPARQPRRRLLIAAGLILVAAVTALVLVPFLFP